MSFAGVSVIANGRLQNPSSVYSGTASGSGYHLLVVEGYSCIKHMVNGAATKSRRFMLGGYRWVLKLYPNGKNAESTDFVSIDLILDQEVAQPVRVYLDCSFIYQVKEQAPACIRATDACDFSSSDRSWGRSCGMNRKYLEQSEYLKDDCFTIRCHLIIQEPLGPFFEVPSSNISQHFKKLLETKVGTDVTFMVDGETFVAHRCFLAARSAVFMAQLLGPMKEGTTDKFIQIQDMEASVSKALIRFIYTDEMELRPSSMGVEGEVEDQARAEVIWLQHLLVAADRYDVQRLKLMCEEQLVGHMDLTSVATILALAAQHHCCGRLKDACLGFLSILSVTALQGVMNTADWKNMAITYPFVLNELIAKLASKV